MNQNSSSESEDELGSSSSFSSRPSTSTDEGEPNVKEESNDKDHKTSEQENEELEQTKSSPPDSQRFSAPNPQQLVQNEENPTTLAKSERSTSGETAKEETAQLEPQKQVEADDDLEYDHDVTKPLVHGLTISYVYQVVKRPEQHEAHYRRICEPEVIGFVRSRQMHKRMRVEVTKSEVSGLYIKQLEEFINRASLSTLVRLSWRLERSQSDSDQGQMQVKTLEHSLKLLTHYQPDTTLPRQINKNDTLPDAAVINNFNNDVGTEQPVLRAELELYIGQIAFDDHETFTLSDVRQGRLEATYRAYVDAHTQARWKLHLDRLAAYLKRSSDTYKSDGHVDLNTELALQDAEAAVNELVKLQSLHYQLLTKEQEIKYCTDQQTEGVSLVEYHVASPIVLDVLEVFLNLMSTFQKEDTIDKYNSFLLDLQEKLAAFRSKSGFTKTIFILADSSPTKRDGRKLRPYRNDKVQVSLYIDGQFACSSKAVAIRSRTAFVEEHIRVRAAHQPRTVQLLIHDVHGSSGNKSDFELNTLIPVVVPGGKAALSDCLSPYNAGVVYDWYRFSNASPIPRTKYHRSFAGNEEGKMSRHRAGRIHICSRWVDPTIYHQGMGQDLESHRNCVLPSPPPIAFGIWPSCRDVRRYFKSTELESGKSDMSSLVQYRADDKEEHLMLIGATVPTLSRRNYILKLRHTGRYDQTMDADAAKATQMVNADVFTRPIPLLDRELVTNDSYLSILRPEVRAFDRRLRYEEADREDLTLLERREKLQMIVLEDALIRLQGGKQRATTRSLSSEAEKNRRGEIVRELQLPSIPSLFDWNFLLQLFQRRRRLRPQRALTVQSKVIECPTHASLYIQVLKAWNMPRRNKLHSESKAEFFIEVSFQGTKKRTSFTSVTDEDGYCIWLETIVVPFYPPRQIWSVDELEQCKDLLKFQLLDHTAKLAKERNGREESEEQDVNHVKHECRVIGEGKIPFSSVYHHYGCLETAVQLVMPAERIGYGNKDSFAGTREATDDSTLEDDGSNHLPESRNAKDAELMPVVLQLRMTVEPQLPTRPAQPLMPSISGSAEDRSDKKKLYKYAAQWSRDFLSANAFTKQRRHCVLQSYQGDQHALVTQYIRPQSPPRELVGSPADNESVVQNVLAFVSLLPHYSDYRQTSIVKESWEPSQQVLELGIANDAEHAILLCNYLLWIYTSLVAGAKVETYAVVGRGVRGDEDMYVLLVRDASKANKDRATMLFDASSGTCYRLRDPACPLYDVSIVISQVNIYGNLQDSRLGFQSMVWDFNNSGHWKPFFNASSPVAMAEIEKTMVAFQNEKLVYKKPCSREDLDLMSRELSDSIKMHVRRWRSGYATTTFVYEHSVHLKRRLEWLSRAYDLLRPAANEDIPRDDLATLAKKYYARGEAVKIPFTTVNNALLRVRRMSVHSSKEKAIEFALAVLVTVLPNDMLVVWVYFLSLTRKT